MNLKFQFGVLLCLSPTLAVFNLGGDTFASSLEGAVADARAPVVARTENELNERLYVNVGLGYARNVEDTLNAGANVHALDTGFRTPLHFIIKRIFEAQFLGGSLDILDVLLAHGADPDFRVDQISGRNLQTPYEYFESNYAGDDDEELVAAVRERLDNARRMRIAPATVLTE